ncbi:hypothetical protein S83_050270, partial [Arachis hypogaea]
MLKVKVYADRMFQPSRAVLIFCNHAILIYLASAFPGIADHWLDVWCGPGIELASDHASTSVDCVVARKNASSRRNLDAVERATHREEPLLFLNSMTVLDCLIDQRLYIDLPDAKQRVQIFGVHSSGKQLAEDVDFEK